MTDPELERALFALPLEEPPAGLRARILAATVARPRLTVPAWEFWLAGTLLAGAVWATWLVASSTPRVAASIVHAVLDDAGLLLAAFTPANVAWLCAGAACAYAISSFSLPVRRSALDR